MRLHRDCSNSQLVRELSSPAAEELSVRGFVSVSQDAGGEYPAVFLLPVK